MYHPTTRVLAVLELLQTHAQLSGADIAARLGIDTRTVRRYIVTLEEIGIPITSRRGRDGGYALMAGFKLPPMMFTDDEALALSVGLLAARGLALAEAAPAAASAQAKLERIMPAELKRRVRAVSQTVRLDFSGPSTAPSANQVLVALSSAALAQQRVLLHYRGQDGARSEREVDPYGLALRGGCWYLVGLCRLRGGMRSFRLDRIASVAPRPLTFARPAGFDALAYLRESIAGITRAHAIEVILKTDLQSASAHFFDEIGFFEPTADGVRLRGQADDLDWFARQLCAAPFDARIVAPDALRASVAALAGRLAAMAQLG
jgi:predicted DNA-binding transcriptional regulator YafY